MNSEASCVESATINPGMPIDFERCKQERESSAVIVALAGALLMAAAMGIGRFSYTPLLPMLRETLGWSVTQAGDVAAANFVGYMLGALSASLCVLRANRRVWLIMAMLSSVATTGGGTLVEPYLGWAAIRFASGVASAFCLVLCTAEVTDVLAARNQLKFGALHFAGVGAGIIISVAVIELARAAGASVFGQWGALGITSGVLMAGSWLMLPAHPRTPIGASVGVTIVNARADSSRMLARLIGAYGLFGYGYIVTATFIVAMARQLGTATPLEPMTWIVVGVTATPSVLVWHHIAQRRGIMPTLRLAYLVEAVGVVLAGVGGGSAAVVIGGGLLGGTFVGITALGLGAARQIASHNPGRAIGWMTASFGLGQLLGPAISGRLAQVTGGFAAPSLVAAALLFVGIWLLCGVELTQDTN